MSPRILNVGVIGCGGFCKGNHIPNLLANPALRIRALCDLNTAVLAELKESFPVDYLTTDFQKIFADAQIDMVVCATKPDFRLPIMEAAIKTEKPLFVEKPLCFTKEDTFRMLEMMRGTKIPFMVGFNRPFSPMIQDAKRYFGQYCQNGNKTLIYRIIGEARIWPKSHYRAIIEEGESTLIHEGTHIFNLLNYLTGNYPLNVYTAGGGNVDNIVTLEYPGNTTAVIIAGDNSNIGFPKEYLEINAEYTTIAGYNFAELEVFTVGGQHFNHKYSYSVGKDIFTTDRREMETKLWEFRKNISKKDLEIGYYYDTQVMGNKGHIHELEAFRSCIVNGEPSPIDVRAGAAANFIAWSALESWEKKQRIELDIRSLMATAGV